MSLTHEAARGTFNGLISSTLKYVNKDREKNLMKLVDLTEHFMAGNYPKEAYDGARKLIQDPNGKWMQYLNKALDEIDPNIIKTATLNLGFEAGLYSIKKIRKLRNVHDCNIPWAMLIDPTSACNLRCKGCWAAEYGHKLSLSYEELDSIITQGKELGIYFYLYTGGEPLTRKDDLLRLCEKHNDCEFHAFTNGTLIDDDFCEKVVKVGNFTMSVSIDGSKEVNDERRGEGVYDKIIAGMDKLKEYGILFGTSVCYTSQNVYSVTSDEFLDMLIEKGSRFIWYFHYMPVGNDAAVEFGTSVCYTSQNVYSVTSDEFLDMLIEKGSRFIWYFHYMPVGNDAAVDLLPNPEQRAYMYNRVREIRSLEGGKPIFAIDFQNDGEYIGGCIAGGRNYLHINPNGDVEPCVFIHYSSANIKEVTLLEALKQPLFMAYRENQPFNNNHLRPCPMLENPEYLREMVKKCGAKSGLYV